MKKFIILLLIISTVILKAQTPKNLNSSSDLRIGLSLAGGGAKGFAHVGVLKVIDSLGIKIDYVSGTSMGAIVGGLYASGYTPDEIEALIKSTDFVSLLNNEKTREDTTFFDKTNDKYIVRVPIRNGKINLLPRSISSGQKNIYMLRDLFKGVAGQSDFSKLPIPFMCMATNLETGKLKIFENGDLVKSIMASAAFPSLLDPVKINDSLYIDGAMTVNYPSKQLKDKGMDIVIGVDLNQGLKIREDLNSAVDILNQVVDFQIQSDTRKQYLYTDINIKPNLKNYSSTSYDKKDSIIIAGYIAAQDEIGKLKKLPSTELSRKIVQYNKNFSRVYKIDSIELKGNINFNENYVKGKMNLKTPTLLTYSNINQMIDRLYATNNYELINYTIRTIEGINYLKLNLNEDTNIYFLKFGLHYDEIYKTGLLLNATIKRPFHNNSRLGLDIIVGNQPRYYFNYFIDNGFFPSFGLSSVGTQFDFTEDEQSNLNKWTWINNRLYLQSTWKDRYAVGIGLSHDYFEGNTLSSENFINAYGFIQSDTRDNKNFPKRGIFLDTRVSLIDLFNKEIVDKLIQTRIDFSFNIPITKKFTYRSKLNGGFTLGENLNEFYKYRSGGLFQQKIGNFVPYYGMEFGNIPSRNTIALDNSVQYNLNKNFYFTFSNSLLNTFDEINLNNIIKIRHTSFNIMGGYDSPFGQIKLNLSHNFTTNEYHTNVILGHWF